jgi:hypothetical protein
MPVAAIIGGIATLAPVAEKYLNIPNKDDPRRFGEAETWYRAAIAGGPGSADALCALKHMTGSNGCTTCGTLGYRCGFATASAKEFCARVYSQALQVLSGNLPPTTPLPPRPDAQGANAGTVNTIATTAGTISDVTGALATGLGQPSTPLGSPTQTRERLEIAGWVGLAIVGAVVVYFVFASKR